MKILKVIREESSITIRDEVSGPHSEELRTIEYHDAPTADFDKAMQGLKEVVKGLMELPDSWVETIKIRGLTCSYTKAGTMSSKIIFERPMAITDNTHRMTTPTAQADEPAEGEDQERELSSAQAYLVYSVLDEADSYVGGKRQQQELPLSTKEKESTPEEDDPDLLKFETPPAESKAAPKKAAAKKKKATTKKTASK